MYSLKPAVKFRKPLPLWIANAVVFLLMFLAVCAYFSWQIDEVERSVLFHAQQYADVVSKIVGLNAKGTLEAQRSIENILSSLLGNTARFVAYLDRIEPFSSDELTAFTRESGLAGITILRHGNSGRFVRDDSVNGPADWLPADPALDRIKCSSEISMLHLEASHLYVLIWTEPGYSECILLGIKDSRISAITDSLGLNNIIKAVLTVHGIRDVEISNISDAASESGRNKKTHDSMASSATEAEIPGEESTAGAKVPAAPAIIHKNGVDVARACQTVQSMEINVEVDAGHLSQSIRQLTIHFYLFSCFLVIAGILLSFVLHRYQSAVLEQVKQFERELADQRENAALGKSAAAIAHEIRNPLNSLSMGLQRLKLERACPSLNHVTLIDQMGEAVKRANRSVTGLLNYARPMVPRFSSFRAGELVEDILNLYQRQCLNQKIEVSSHDLYHEKVESDPELVGQVVENIIKNAVEAQPEGGYIDITVEAAHDFRHSKPVAESYIALVFRNGNCPIEPAQAGQILEPYFTTRPEGTGLGMAIVRNIVRTLDGEIRIEISELRDISTIIYLPVKEDNDAYSNC